MQKKVLIFMLLLISMMAITSVSFAAQYESNKDGTHDVNSQRGPNTWVYQTTVSCTYTTKNATCTSAGAKTYDCVCGYKATQTIPAKGHSWKNGVCSECNSKCTHSRKTNVPPTKKDNDTHYRNDQCNTCHMLIQTEEPHSNYTTTNATCTSPGKKVYNCGCGYKGTTIIPAKGHSWKNGVCSVCKHECEHENTTNQQSTYKDKNTHYRYDYCNICKMSIRTEESHKFSNWSIHKDDKSKHSRVCGCRYASMSYYEETGLHSYNFDHVCEYCQHSYGSTQHNYITGRVPHCSICSKQLGSTCTWSRSFSDWGGYTPGDPGITSFSGGSIRLTFDGKLPADISAKLTYNRYTACGQSWHNATAEEYNLPKTAYTTHLGAGGMIHGGGSITGVVSGNTITFNGLPSGARYKFEVTVGTLSIASKRYVSGGGGTHNDPSTYTVTVIHHNETTGEDMGAIEYKELKKGSEKTVSALTEADLKNYGSGINYTNKVTVKRGNKLAEEYSKSSMDIKNIDSNVTVTFYYSQSARIKVVGRLSEDPYTILYEEDIPDIILSKNGVTKNYTARDEKDYIYEGYKIENGLISTEGKGTSKITSDEKASVKVTAESREKTVTFLYKEKKDINNFSLIIEHRDKSTDNLMTDTVPMEHYLLDLLKYYGADGVDEGIINNDTTTYEEIVSMVIDAISKAGTVDENGSETLKSLNLTLEKYKGYVNAGYAVCDEAVNDEEITESNRYLPNLEEISKIIKRQTGAREIRLTFYYESPQCTVTVKHVDDATGEIIKDEGTVTLTIGDEFPKTWDKDTFENYEYVGVTKPDGTESDDPEVTIDELIDGGILTIIFKYKEKEEIPIRPPEEEDPEYYPVTCDPEGPSKVALDSEFIIKIPNDGIHQDFLEADNKNYNETNAIKKAIKFPFEVYFNNELKTANEWIELDVTTESFKFRIPLWVEEKAYLNVEVMVVSKAGDESIQRDQSNDVFGGGATATGTISIEVVGKIYDFSVTNLEKDEMWANNLFPTLGTEYEAKELPVGQKTDKMPAAYKYGIKLGSPFLFSVNTLGIKSKAIKIIPKIYFVGKDGGEAQVAEGLQYKVKTGYVDFDSDAITLSTKINKPTRMTAEVTAEVKKSLEMKSDYLGYGQDTNTLRGYGKFDSLLITDALRLPNVKFKAEMTDKELSAASHWYAEYKLPATLISDNAKENDGFYIVCFEITSLDGAKNDYLQYENQPVGNQWENENEDCNGGSLKTTLPNGKEVTIKNANTYYPVAIYENIPVNSDYETSGTH